MADGGVRVVGAPDRRRSAARAAAAPSRPAAAWTRLEPTHLQAPRPTFANGAHVAVVALDRDTGCVDVVDYVVVHDAGRVVNPLIVEGQLHGGVAQGVGGALWEELAYDEHGQLLTQSLLDYVMPTATQVPAIRIASIVTPSPLNPLGVKGVGEAGTLAPPAALAAAVEDALRPFGARIVATPLRPEHLQRLIRGQRGADNRWRCRIFPVPVVATGDRSTRSRPASFQYRAITALASSPEPSACRNASMSA